jgi:hypothetical protein
VLARTTYYSPWRGTLSMGPDLRFCGDHGEHSRATKLSKVTRLDPREGRLGIVW